MRALLLALPLALALMATTAQAKVLAYPREACTTVNSTHLDRPQQNAFSWMFQMSCTDTAGALRVFTFTWDPTWLNNTPEVVTLIAADVDTLQER